MRRLRTARCCISARFHEPSRTQILLMMRAVCFKTCWRSASARRPEIAERFPKVQRRVGGYNLDALVPRNAPNNMAHLLGGSEGTLAFTTRVELKLWPVIRNKVLGVCHFGSFYEAMDAAQHLVKLRPIAVELVDRTMIALAARSRCLSRSSARPFAAIPMRS